MGGACRPPVPLVAPHPLPRGRASAHAEQRLHVLLRRCFRQLPKVQLAVVLRVCPGRHQPVAARKAHLYVGGRGGGSRERGQGAPRQRRRWRHRRRAARPGAALLHAPGAVRRGPRAAHSERFACLTSSGVSAPGSCTRLSRCATAASACTRSAYTTSAQPRGSPVSCAEVAGEGRRAGNWGWGAAAGATHTRLPGRAQAPCCCPCAVPGCCAHVLSQQDELLDIAPLSRSRREGRGRGGRRARIGGGWQAIAPPIALQITLRWAGHGQCCGHRRGAAHSMGPPGRRRRLGRGPAGVRRQAAASRAWRVQRLRVGGLTWSNNGFSSASV